MCGGGGGNLFCASARVRRGGPRAPPGRRLLQKRPLTPTPTTRPSLPAGEELTLFLANFYANAPPELGAMAPGEGPMAFSIFSTSDLPAGEQFNKLQVQIFV